MTRHLGSAPKAGIYSRMPCLPSFADVFRALSDTLLRRVAADDLRRLLRDRFQTRHVTLTASGREALLLALQGVHRQGSHVVVPAFGCPIVTAVVRTAGMEPVFADIELSTLQPSVDSFLKQLDARTVAVIVVHEFGLPMRRHELRRVRDGFGGLLIEDAALAPSARYEDSAPIGSVGDLCVLSASLGKPLSACAWGALMDNRAERAHFVANLPQASSAVSVARALAGLVLQWPPTLRLLKPWLSASVATDAQAAPHRARASSSFDDALLCRLLRTFADLDASRRAISARLARDLSALGFGVLPCNERHMAVSRFPFFCPETTDPEIAIRRFAGAGFDIVRPYQYNFSGATPTRYPNAFVARTRLLALTIRPDFDKELHRRFVDCAASLLERPGP
jgi:dTDP-4-amino-4,6-dideoxygalactose transaminase